MIEGFCNESILARAQKKGLAEIHLHNLRDYSADKWKRVDDYPYGGFAGMVMQCEPIDRCISALKAERDYDEVIFTSPDGIVNVNILPYGSLSVKVISPPCAFIIDLHSAKPRPRLRQLSPILLSLV